MRDDGGDLGGVAKFLHILLEITVVLLLDRVLVGVVPLRAGIGRREMRACVNSQFDQRSNRVAHTLKRFFREADDDIGNRNDP